MKALSQLNIKYPFDISPLSLKYIINKKPGNALIKKVIKRGNMGNTSKPVGAMDACWQRD